MRRKNTPQEAKKSREKKVRKAQERQQRAAYPVRMEKQRTVSAHALHVLHNRRFPEPGT